ncbi:hypothetical protein E2562_025073 [Oryza meyeriana var. granulata]|uniref:Uncharacterized protein n=1 Tax=Oryza meyeriana var. granulata TaxID=110450 RepID=A0A6G1D7X1_9ORYZ|nr:hypothetical protein E2562_025073 [Oryza meyeriana var. granulata]
MARKDREKMSDVQHRSYNIEEEQDLLEDFADHLVDELKDDVEVIHVQGVIFPKFGKSTTIGCHP